MSEVENKTRFAKLGRFVSVTALAAGALAGQQAAAQGFAGTGTATLGTPDLSTPGTVVVRDTETIINWRPNDTSGTGTIDFLPSTETVLFRNEVSGVSDFTVLNRILPVDGNGLPVSRIVGLNGTVRSEINGSTGGNVWFYAPGGIIVGAGSVFDVGSLVLTSNDIDATGGLFDPATGAIRFRGAADSLSAVQVSSGAQINALSPGSYVALVAPRVVQAGTVTVNGTTAYVAAEQADIRINGGLFDISIGAGTTDANGVVHTGTTERPSTTVEPDIAQRVYMVAVPKNNALTMLLSGNIGYAAADTAVQTDSAVVLSAGHDVTGGFAGAANATATGEANITIGAGTFQPEVRAVASGEIIVRPVGGTTQFDRYVSLSAARAVTLRADQGAAITASGDMDVAAGLGGVGGKIDLLSFGGSGSSATNGRIAVTGGLNLDASAFGDGSFNFPVTVGGDATGGDIAITATGGAISAGSLSAYANATAGAGTDSSGDATGGTISLSALTIAGPSVTEAGALTFGSTSLDAQARTEFIFPAPTDAGIATGGKISIAATGGSFSAADLNVDASAGGGDGLNMAGTATGGDIVLSASAAGGLRGSFAVADCSSRSCEADVSAYGGYGRNGGNGTGGSILIHATDADLSVGGDFYLYAGAIGGGTTYGDGMAGRAGDGTGGSIAIESRAGNGVMSFANIYASADGASMDDVEGPSFNDGDGGTGTGGAVNLLVAGGSLTADGFYAGASGKGGAAGINCPTCEGAGTVAFRAGAGQGGTAQMLVTGGSATLGVVELTANGRGGEARAAEAPGEVSSIAGGGTGGTVLLESRGGTLNAGSITLDASGVGGYGEDTFQADGVDGGAGFGGTAGLLMAAGGTGQVVVDGGVVIRARGVGGVGSFTAVDGSGSFRSGAGGGGTGGMAELTLASGALSAGSVLVSAEGVGGAGGDNYSDGAAGVGGIGTGGIARLSYLNEGHDIGLLTVKADGEGGAAGGNRYAFSFDQNNNPIYDYGPGAGGSGGGGIGGMADMLIDVDPSFASLTVSAEGIGSAGGIGATGGAGGSGTGGVATFNIAFGTTIVSGFAQVSASGFGGDGGVGVTGSGGRGGDGTGGQATLGLTGVSTSLDAGGIAVLAHGAGGNGGLGGLQQTPGVGGADGGDATGGTALFSIADGAGATAAFGLTVSGSAFGGSGSAGTAGPVGGAGGSGGDAAAGSAALRLVDGRLRMSGGSMSSPSSLRIEAEGTGGAGAIGGDGSDPGFSGGMGGSGGSGAGGTAAFDATNGDYAVEATVITANGLRGFGGAGGAGPGGTAAAGTDGLSSGGTAQLVNGGAGVLAAGGLRQMAALTMTADGLTGGRVLFNDSSTGAGGGLNVLGSMALSAMGNPVVTSGVDFAAAANRVQVGGDADFATQGSLRFAFSGGGGLTVGGALTGMSGTGMVIGHDARAAGGDSLSADSLYLVSAAGINVTGDAALRAAGPLTMLAQGGDISLPGSAVLNAGGDLTLYTPGSLLGANATLTTGGTAAFGVGASGEILLGGLSAGQLDMADASGNALGAGGIAIGGDFVVNGLLSAGGGTLSAASIRVGTLNGGAYSLTAPGGVEIGDADLTGLLQISTPAAARLTGAVAAAAIDVDAGSIVANGLTARAGDLSLRSVADLTVTQGQAAGDVLLSSSAGDVTASDISAAGTVTALGRNVSVGSSGDLRIAQVAASGTVALNAGGLFSLQGAVDGTDVTIGSGDIVLGSGARVTASGLLRLRALGQQAAVVGGGDVTSGYSLSATEVAQLSAANLTVEGAGDLIVRDLTVGATVLPGGGVMTLSAANGLRVEGALRMTGRTGTGGLTLVAGQAVTVVTDSGLVDLRDGNGALGGVLVMSAPTITVASLAAIADLADASSVTARDQRLAQNDGLVSEEGWLRAGTIRLVASDGLFVQNSGVSSAFADRRGFTANAVEISGSGAPQIAINGRLALSDGTFATGLDAIPLVAISGGYAAGSRINGCLIGGGASCTGVTLPDNREVIEAVIDPAVTVAKVFPTTLIQLRDVVEQGYPPLIDEPVTGAGNEDLWERRCGGEGEPECAAQ